MPDLGGLWTGFVNNPLVQTAARLWLEHKAKIFLRVSLFAMRLSGAAYKRTILTLSGFRCLDLCCLLRWNGWEHITGPNVFPPLRLLLRPEDVGLLIINTGCHGCRCEICRVKNPHHI